MLTKIIMYVTCTCIIIIIVVDFGIIFFSSQFPELQGWRIFPYRIQILKEQKLELQYYVLLVLFQQHKDIRLTIKV